MGVNGDSCYLFGLTTVPRQAAMVDETLLSRISADPLIFGGKPIVRGMRISVS